MIELHPSAPRELTLRALAAGSCIGLVLAAANVYVGLKVGFLDSGNITAAVAGFALFAALRRIAPYSAVENNITATTASAAAVMGPTIGLIGPIAALTMMGHTYSTASLVAWGLALAVLGIAFALPLHRRLISAEKLPFPSGTATAEVISAMARARSEGVRRARALFLAAGLSIIVTWFRDGRPSCLPAALLVPGTIGIGVAISPLMLSTGMLMGLRNGLSVLAGAVVAWGFVAPALLKAGIVAQPDFPSLVSWLLWPGVGLMVSSAVTLVALDWRMFIRGLADLRLRQPALATTVVPARWTLWAVFASIAVILLVGWRAMHISPVALAFALAISLVLSSVCARGAGETDIAPVGAMGGVTQILFGTFLPGQPVTSLAAGGVVNGSATQTAQMLWSLKAGQLLSSTPRRQVLAQLLGVAVGSMVVVPVFVLVVHAYGLGTSAMPAGAAQSWKATAIVVAGGARALPHLAPLAAVVAAGVGVLLTLLGRSRVARFLPSPIALGTAFVLPASYGVSMCIGALALFMLRRRKGEWADMFATSAAAGGIAGESLMGLVIAALMVAGILTPGG